MKNLSDDTKAIVASNLTLAFFIREHTRYAVKDADINSDSKAVVKSFFQEFLATLKP